MSGNDSVQPEGTLMKGASNGTDSIIYGACPDPVGCEQVGCADVCLPGFAAGRAAGLREAADLVLGGDLEVTRVQLADLLRARAEGVDR